jgi:hypothetical protein
MLSGQTSRVERDFLSRDEKRLSGEEILGWGPMNRESTFIRDPVIRGTAVSAGGTEPWEQQGLIE